ncbi:MAG: hypothetical protein RLZZ77_1384 [Bacteroidota bacterium]|jgi:hypothetical protein
MLRSSFLFTFLLISFSAFSQSTEEAEKQQIIEQRIEEIAQSLGDGDELDYTNLLEDLTYYFEHPLDLNTSSEEELRDLNLISDIQIASLQRHIQKYGPLKSIFELQAVSGFSLQTIRLIQPFVTVDAPSFLTGFSWADLAKEGKSTLFMRYRRELQQRAGYIPDPENNNQPNFLGSPDYGYVRYRFDYKKNIRAGLTVEKDAGESLQNGPDFYSGHLFFTDKKWLKTLAIGDYQAQFGQGLTMWSGLGFGKSVYVLNVKKNAQVLRPYSSVNEATYMRGAAATLKKGKFELTTFFSRKKLTANLVQTTDSTLVEDDGLIASSINLGGLHRTAAELEDKNKITEQSFGGHLQYKQGTFNFGITAAHAAYNRELTPNVSLYNQFRFNGKELSNVGFDYQGVIRNANVFGEIAHSSNGGLAMIHGLIASLHPRLSAVALYRYYSPDYQVRYAAAFAEGSPISPNNESGLMIGIEAQLAKAWTLRAYADQVLYPWLTSSASAPSHFADYRAQLNYKPDKKHEIYVHYRVRFDSQDGAINEAIDYTVDRKRQNFRLHAVYAPHPNLQLKTRAEWAIVDTENATREQGFMMYQDLGWKKQGVPVSFTFRYAIMDIQDWNARIYAYENDVLYRFSILPYYGKGSRAYAMVSWDIRRGMELQVRYGQWIYTDRTTISSGNSAISGNQLSDVIAQLHFSF